MAKITLRLDDDECNFSLIGIFSHEKDYKLCWLINKHLNCNFIRTEDLEFFDKKANRSFSYSNYKFDYEKDFISFHLLSNYNNKDVLIPEAQGVNYIFMIKGTTDEKLLNQIITELKEIKTILIAFPIKMEILDNKTKNILSWN